VRAAPADQGRTEPVAVAPVRHLAELDLTPGSVLRLLLAPEQRFPGLQTQQARAATIGGDRLDREARPRRTHPVPLFEDLVQRRLREIDLVEPRGQGQGDPGAVDQDRHAVHRSQPLELE
jgi:hypothetical protein